jgi:ATP-dependent Clp protease protease subunit
MWPFSSRRPADQSLPAAGEDPLLGERVVPLRGPLTEGLARDVISKLLFLQYEHPREPIHVRIDSPGGPFFAGMAVVEAMRELTPPVRTEVVGSAHGAAVFVLAAGEPGRRAVGRGCPVSLIPDLPPATAGPADGRRLAEELARVVGREADEVAADVAAGRSFDPGEAVEYGLADLVRAAGFDPRWRTADALGLARGIYDDRAFDRLPILADALTDAGCDDEQMLAHCWVVDLVLGKE